MVSVLASPLAIVTRATLLHVLERPTALGPAEVRELEQLAQAFPYCQTAHLLLAKAAHDQGTMLAGQRLRRAATYAADRTLLRRLIEEVVPLPEADSLLVPPHPLDFVDWPDEYVPPVAASLVVLPLAVALAAPASAEALPPVAPSVTTALPVAEAPAPVAESVVAAEISGLAASANLPELVTLPEAASALIPEPPLIERVPPALGAPVALSVPATVAPVVELIGLPGATPAEATPAETPAAEMTGVVAPAIQATPEIAILALAPPEILAASETPVATAEPLPAAISEAAAPIATELSEPMEPALPLPVAPTISATTPITPAAEAALAPAAELPEAELPAQAPAIRPPVGVGEARFEFGLADPAPTTGVHTYELPGLVDEWAASAVTRGLGSPEMLALAVSAPVVPVFTPAAFTGDVEVGYAFGESSRLGLSMQLLDLLTARAEAAESATTVVAAAQPPAAPLPPTGTFFEPDLLLLHHWATHRPAAPEQPSTVDLINNFLKRQPRLTRPAMLPPAATHQADLSVRSTRAEPDLVSENLARIFVRQGKTARAIEIYEKLMVKQPEKMAYFTSQIQSLQPSA